MTTGRRAVGAGPKARSALFDLLKSDRVPSTFCSAMWLLTFVCVSMLGDFGSPSTPSRIEKLAGRAINTERPHAGLSSPATLVFIRTSTLCRGAVPDMRL